MDTRFIFFLFALFLPTLAACAPPQSAPERTEAADPSPRNLIVIRDFRVNSSTRVVVDTSFGFSLHHGHPGVPLQKRAASISRAAAFDVADALTERLRRLGYAAVHADANTRNPAGKALIVVGLLRVVNEGHRRNVGHEHAAVVADAEIDEATRGVKPLLALHVDSTRLADDGLAGPRGPGAPALGIAAARVGREIANSVVTVARRVGISPVAR